MSPVNRVLPERAASRMDRMTPRELLMLLTSMGQLATQVNRSTFVAPAKGPRGIRRRARVRRRRAHAARLQRNSWRAYGEALKKAGV